MNINRRQFLRAGIGAAGGLSLLSCLRVLGQTHTPANAPPRPPNIIFVLADDLGLDCVGSYGSDRFKTPFIDALASGGTRFERCYATPLCGPTRCQLMTGLYPFRTGAIDNHETHRLRAKDHFSLAKVLKSAGYATCQVGKWRQMEETPGDWGFDEFLTDSSAGGVYWTKQYNRNGQEITLPEEIYEPDLLHTFAADFIGRHREKPFFLYYAMHFVHEPIKRTPDSKGVKGDDDLFVDNIAYMDKLVGQLMDVLAATGTRDNTLVIFGGDNGTAARHDGTICGKKLNGSKGTMQEGGVRVPLIAHWPGVIAPGSVNRDLIDFSDFFPTFAAISGAVLPNKPPVDGQNFLPQLRGRPGKPRDWIFVQLGSRWFASDGHWKLMEDGALFNVTNSPFEETPVPIDDHNPEAADARKRLQAVLDRLDPAAQSGHRKTFSGR
jgi:arylsulfatase A